MLNRISDYLPVGWRTEHHRSAAKAAGESAPTENVPESSWLEPVMQVVKSHPGAALASAFCVGVCIAWWIKRR